MACKSHSPLRACNRQPTIGAHFALGRDLPERITPDFGVTRMARSLKNLVDLRSLIGAVPPNVQDEPRPWLARLVLLGARDVTAMVVGSGALLGFVWWPE